MELASYIGLKLKSDPVMELLEYFDMTVIYDFDRLHENTEDRYSASARTAGFEVQFNERQVLETIWCYIKPRDGFESIDQHIVGTPFFRTLQEAKSYARETDAKTSESKDGNTWIRFDHGNLWVHYEFSDNQLALLTFVLPVDYLR